MTVNSPPSSSDTASAVPELENTELTILPAATSTLLGPVLVRSNTGNRDGNYQLVLQINHVPKSLEIPFIFNNASQWTQELTDAKHSKDEADRRLRDCLAQLSDQQAAVNTMQNQISERLAHAQQQFPVPVSAANWQQVRDSCHGELMHLPQPRAATVPLNTRLSDAEKSTLHQIPGVLGFVYDLLSVADNTDARLLSWFAQRSLLNLVVATWEAKLAVEHLWLHQWGKHNQRLTIWPLSTMRRAHAQLQSQVVPPGRHRPCLC